MLNNVSSEPIEVEANGKVYDLIMDLEDIDGDPYNDEEVFMVMTDGIELGYTMGTDDTIDEYLYEFSS